MAMIQCARHGLCPVTMVCRHIKEAVARSKTAEFYHICLDEFFAPYVCVCPDCSDQYGIPSQVNAEDVMQEFQLICGNCFDDWLQTVTRSSETRQLLADWIHQAPQRASEVARLLADSGIDQETITKELAVKVMKAEPGTSMLPTFDPRKERGVSPMLAARMSYAGTISDNLEKWLSVREISKQINSKKIRKVFDSLKNHWVNSAPAIFREDQISIFGISRGNENDITFLVWNQEDEQEPQIFRYFGQSESIFANLNAFLEWTLFHDSGCEEI